MVLLGRSRLLLSCLGPFWFGVAVAAAQNQSDAQRVLAICILIVILFSIIDGFILRPIARRYSINITET